MIILTRVNRKALQIPELSNYLPLLKGNCLPTRPAAHAAAHEIKLLRPLAVGLGHSSHH